MVWPGVCSTSMVTLPTLNTSPSWAMWASKVGLALGPYTMGAPVFSERVTCPDTKSAWKCVSKMYLIFLPPAAARSR